MQYILKRIYMYSCMDSDLLPQGPAFTTTLDAHELSLHLKTVAVVVLDPLDVEDEGELGDDVQKGPTHLEEPCLISFE